MDVGNPGDTKGVPLIDTRLRSLAERAWRLHQAATTERWLVRPSAPVLYFGNSSAYRLSPLRIATVALNPSRLEFPDASPFSRFPGVDADNIAEYLRSLELLSFG